VRKCSHYLLSPEPISTTVLSIADGIMTCPVFWTIGCLAAYWVIHQSLIFQLLAEVQPERLDERNPHYGVCL
jgi:hypothetical protein